MYRIKEIVDSFKTLVGWKQGRVEGSMLSDSVTRSDSGLYFQEAHPMLTTRAMNAIMPDKWGEGHKEFDMHLTYKKDDIVEYTEKLYISLQDGNKGHDVLDGEWWSEYHVIDDYLNDLTETGVKQVINRFIRDKVIGMETRNIVDRRTLFDGAGRIDNRVENTGRLCGFEITPLRSEGITARIEKIGLQFVGNMGDVTMYLFHSSCAEPLWSQTFHFDKKNGTFKWFNVEEMYLPYVSERTNAGGSWYLVYDQNALPPYMESINFARDWSREPCATCNKGDVQLYRTMSKYVQISPFCVDVDSDWDKTLWDIQDNIYTNTTNYGINLQMSIGCDLTDFMIQERMQFASVIQLQVANNALRALALNPEVNVNRVQANADRNNILYELDGNGMAVKGLHGDLEKAYKALSFDTKGLSEVCLTCHNKGVRFRSV